MHNNRRNTRFGMFIVAIIVSLLVFLTGCSSAQNETDTVAPVIENSSNPVTLTVYLTAHYANPDTHCPIYEKLLDYQKENPNITIQFVSPKEGDTAEREAEIHQLNTEILSGKGPDLFIMEGNRLTNVNLFPDIEKSMMNGAFLDLTDVMDSNEFTTENFYMPLLAPIRAYNKCIGSAIPDTSLQVCHQPAYPKGKPKGEYSIPANP